MIRNVKAYASTIEKKSKRIGLTAEKFNLCKVTVSKYLKMTEDEIKALDEIREYKKRDKPVAANGYLNMIYKMIRDGKSCEQIFWYVSSKGYTGERAALENAIKSIAKNNFGISFGPINFKYVYKRGSIVIKRRELLIDITAKGPKYKHNKVIQEHMLKIIEKYPIVKKVIEIYNDFHSAIMGTDPDKLDEFITKHDSRIDEADPSKSYFSPIQPFINGLKKDITPAKNAISYPESSGYVEGNNNKFKVIKRILYGRSKLVNLFRKSYLCFSFGKEGFNLKASIKIIKKRK